MVSHCTCLHTDCPQHPTMHEQGCTPCIAKNLAGGEIPCCFFAKATGNPDGKGDYSIDGFVRAVLAAREDT